MAQSKTFKEFWDKKDTKEARRKMASKMKVQATDKGELRGRGQHSRHSKEANKAKLTLKSHGRQEGEHMEEGEDEHNRS